MGLDGYCLTVYRIMSELVHKFLRAHYTRVMGEKCTARPMIFDLYICTLHVIWSRVEQQNLLCINNMCKSRIEKRFAVLRSKMFELASKTLLKVIFYACCMLLATNSDHLLLQRCQFHDFCSNIRIKHIFTNKHTNECCKSSYSTTLIMAENLMSCSE